jgi:hypothetical protein
LQRQLAEYFPEVLPQPLVQRLSSTLRMNTTWYLHSHFEWLRLLNSSIV